MTAAHLATDAVGVEIERVADALEGERPGRVARVEPLPRLAAGPAPRPLAEDVDGILEDGGHETELADLVSPRTRWREIHDHFAENVGHLLTDGDVRSAARHGLPS